MKRVLVSWMFIRFLILIPFKMHAAGKIFILKMTATGYQRTYLVSVLSLILLSFCSFCTASEVTDVFPPGGSHSAAVATDLSVTLDATVDPGTVDSSTFVVHGGFHAPITGVFSTDSNTFTFDTSNDFHPGELIQATVSNGVEAGGEPVNPYVWWFRSDVTSGFGTFVDSGQALGKYSSLANALGDLDGDGDLDAFVICYTFAQVYFNDGTGQLTNSGQRLGEDMGENVALGDIDGDGDLDAFVVNWDTPDTVWMNDGNGMFTDSGQQLWTRFHGGVSLGDLDADSDLDAFIAASDGIKIWVNDGTGIFIDSGQSPGDAFGIGAVLGDLDGDGDLDAFITVCEANRVWLNDGSGIFSDSGQSLGQTWSWDVSLGDLDGDGDLDAIVANETTSNRVWLNEGNGIFTRNDQSLGNFDSFGSSLGDLDGDGDLDAYISNYVHVDNVLVNKILPTPTPTSTPICPMLGCTITMPGAEFHPGDPCFVDVTICNPDVETYKDIPVFVILDVYGEYFFAPSYSDFEHYNMDVARGETIINVLPEFIWPTNSGSASGVFWYAGMTNPEMTALFGAMDTFEFGWTE